MPDLGETFDAVVLPSNLISTVEPVRRRQFLTTGARHLAAGGVLLVQWFPATWFDDLIGAGERSRHLGDVLGTVRLLSAEPTGLTAEVRYDLDGRHWTQRFQAYRLTEPQLAAELEAAGLRLTRWLDPARSWFAATGMRV
ncbi:hypothetical protein GCM10010168_25160 [Actinoplanes ianthinogenes]|uniref:Methyltransferase n=1 Tax=Actinoplanes ianthinogenes TaxID=122358 RepID=A0ABM7M911_9ACTN|nr:hypothetical protein [Actinoplanes ianthinogenes]BCJ48156.1 hypothetical protein Aiant_88130 [Actinoplanes ianthinogenes]GGR06835.1 hypothetical protein GCM10010168_25160 [Actinoplanes ianthinogenes]